MPVINYWVNIPFLKAIFPSTSVISMEIFPIFSGAMEQGSSDRITRSAALPASILPFRSSSKANLAPLIVNSLIASENRKALVKMRMGRSSLDARERIDLW